MRAYRQQRRRQQVILVLLCLLVLVCCGALVSSQSKTCEHRTGSSGELKEDNVCSANNGPNQDLGTNDCFRAAVVDYSRIDATDNCRDSSDKNLDVYEKIARLAKENGVQMLVFSEDGILYGTERYVQPCLEEIPDPMLAPDYIPCSQPNRFNQTMPILTRLSCLAKEYGLYIVANYGTKQRRENCPSEGCQMTKGAFGKYLMLNTDVVFDPSGKYIRRYRKWHPFVFTEMFAKAPHLEHVYFDTEFGRFGVFTCFDMLFKQPAIDLVEKFNIDTVVFPTYWFDEVPLLPAVQYQDGWSSTNRVNLLASNILKPSTGSIGSSIFSGDRSLYLTPDLDVPGKPRRTTILISTIQSRRQSEPSTSVNLCKANSKIIEIEDNASYQKYTRKSYKVMASDNIQSLSKPKDKKTVCSGKVCCTIDYELAAPLKGQPPSDANRLVILVRDSLRISGWYEQVCTVATLTKPFVAPKSGATPAASMPQFELEGFDTEGFDSEAAASFKRLSLRAIFQTKYVFPSCAHNLTRLVERSQRHMQCSPASSSDGTPKHVCELNYSPARSDEESNRLYTFGMYGRLYERDQKDL